MKRSQFDMFVKLLSTMSKAKVKEHTFIITARQPEIFQLTQVERGISTVLKVGTWSECINAAKECIEMMYEITD